MIRFSVPYLINTLFEMNLTKLHCIVTASTFPSLLVNPSQCSKYFEHLSHCSVMDGSLVHIVSFWDLQELIYK